MKESNKIDIQEVRGKLLDELELHDEYGWIGPEIEDIVRVRDEIAVKEVFSRLVAFLDELIEAKKGGADLSDETIRLFETKIASMTVDEIDEILDALVGLKEQQLYEKAVSIIQSNKKRMSFTCDRQTMLQSLESVNAFSDSKVRLHYYVNTRTLELKGDGGSFNIPCKGYFNENIDMEFDYVSLLNYCKKTICEKLTFEEVDWGLSFNGITFAISIGLKKTTYVFDSYIFRDYLDNKHEAFDKSSMLSSLDGIGTNYGSLTKDLCESLSPVARYVYEHYQENYEEDPYGFIVSYEPPKDIKVMEALLSTLSKKDLEKMQSLMPYSSLSSRIEFLLKEDESLRDRNGKQLTISTLLRHFTKKIKGKRSPARWQLQKRFDGQSFSVQVQIMRAFLNSTPGDRDWCYWKFMNWWDDVMIPDLEKAWTTYHDFKCVKAAALRLPESFVKEHQEEMERLDYKHVCLRLAHDKEYQIDKSKLSVTDFCYIISKNRRHISDEEAEQLLFGLIRDRLEDPEYNQVAMFDARNGPYSYYYKSFEEKKKYEPSLLYLRHVGYVIWTLGQTGNPAAIIKFHKWNKKLQDSMPQYLAEEKNEEEILAMMNGNFKDYQEWNWNVFAKHAYLSLGEIMNWDEEREASSMKPLDKFDEIKEKGFIEVMPPKMNDENDDDANLPF